MTDPTPAPAAAPQPAQPLSESDDKLWASLAHFGGVLFILPSLLIYLILKDRGPKVRVEAKEALNWQITFLIIWIVWLIISGILSVALVLTGLFWLPSLLNFVVWAVNALFSILGGIKVNGGGSYRYPFSFRFIK
ncbi:MAG: uncharacterized protein QOD50_1114 [Actinomycetota bacterium]|jgi:uncharacterized Tic20 family protein|nr:uncharacterized protein [Actinomycetota bacterium]